MTTSPGFMRRWAMQRSPLSPPLIVDLSVPELYAGGLDARAIGQVEVPLLRQPEINSTVFVAPAAAQVGANLVQIAVALMPNDLARADWQPVQLFEPQLDDWQTVACYEETLTAWSPIPLTDELAAIATPTRANIKFSFFDVYPQILDLFTGLTAPGKAGKAYGEPTRLQQASLFSDKERQRPMTSRSAQTCIHGLQREYCEICRNRRSTVRQQPPKRTKPARTLDVFDLLLPYLQPPLDQLLAQPVLFPVGLRPRDYQITGIKFLAEREAALLGDEMGLGKTVQTIIALQILYRRGELQRTLILCPRSLLGTWEKEMNKWAPELYIQRVRGTKEEREALWKAHATVYLTTYETLRSDIKVIPGLTTKFQIVILDEVQRIKNPNSESSRAVRRLHARYRWGLSGTPLENKLDDVTAIYRYLLPSLFKTDGVYTPQQVKKLMDPYFLRRRTADVLTELPEKEVQEIWLELTDAQQATYQRAEEEGRRRLTQPDTTRVHVFALINQLKQICNIDPKSGDSCKLDYLTEQLENG